VLHNERVCIAISTQIFLVAVYIAFFYFILSFTQQQSTMEHFNQLKAAFEAMKAENTVLKAEKLDLQRERDGFEQGYNTAVDNLANTQIRLEEVQAREANARRGAHVSTAATRRLRQKLRLAKIARPIAHGISAAWTSTPGPLDRQHGINLANVQWVQFTRKSRLDGAMKLLVLEEL
jgi:septal ring factor EnvC (AmiA/AmiB activator)